MKKAIIAVLVSLIAVSGLFAFDGNTSAGVAYSFDNGHYMGLSSDSTGFFGGSLGYYGGADALFDLTDINNWKIDIMTGPAYRYAFGESGVKLTVAPALSFTGTTTLFSAGLGGYIGADYHFTDNFGMGIGVKLGSNFLNWTYNDLKFSLSGDFFVTPSLKAVFFY